MIRGWKQAACAQSRTDDRQHNLVLALSACLGKISTNQLPKLPNPFTHYKKDNMTFLVLDTLETCGGNKMEVLISFLLIAMFASFAIRFLTLIYHIK